tara:strand:- start:3421 stop:4602 length:1182 start_codon:yes stop_codon:yes gene_type:complete
MVNSINELEEKVQSVYQRVSPSLYSKKKEINNFNKNNAFLKNLFFNYLKIPLGYLENKSMLEFGSGTGEFSVNYLLWKMKADFVELNPISVKKCKKYFKKFSKTNNFKIINKSIFTFKSKKKYDFVSSLGVIHHTDYKKAFTLKAKFLKKNGFMMLGIGNAAGMFQRNLQRYIIYFLSDNNEKKSYDLVKYLFPDFLRRAQKYGRRTLDSIIFDNFINPKDHHPTTKILLNLAKKNKLKLYSSWPPIMPTFLNNSAQSFNYDIDNYKNVLSANDVFSIIHNEDDTKKLKFIDKKITKDIKAFDDLTLLINNIGDKKLPSLVALNRKVNTIKKNLSYKNKIDINYAIFQKELVKLPKILRTKNIEKLKIFLKNTKVLFKGNAGIGMNYYMFYKY